MTKDEVKLMLASRTTTSVITGGRAIGLSKNAAYAAAHNGELPTIKVGKRLLVPTEKLAEMLGMKLTA